MKQREAIAEALTWVEGDERVQVMGPPEDALRLGEAICGHGSERATVVFHVGARSMGGAMVCPLCGESDTTNQA